jgi:hypothetical protein
VEQLLGTKCSISIGAKGKGKLVIPFASEQALNDILKHIQ